MNDQVDGQPCIRLTDLMDFPRPGERMNRWIAYWVIRTRHCMIMGEVAKAKGDQYNYAQWDARFADAWAQLPVSIRVAYRKYISLPAMRQVEREGLLAQNGRYEL